MPRWPLTEVGIRRMRALATWFDAVPPAAVWASTETKAIEGAGIVARRFGLPVHVLDGLGENDRSSTGYLPLDAFQAMADAFFARPDEEVRGWESARAAQARMVASVSEVLRESPPGDVVVVAHGAVSALLRCHLAGAAISRAWDQPGAGYLFAVARDAFPGPGVATEWVALPPG
ncbi:histidine phosphatase family protein [Roseomonas sp. CCTCC AB2023176]|uniref:histidine phosphatase family protein n=1 Tax=Roseomonas sp. CCTCC AB2023176 TaxID=3342640 RepID=UPI0035E118ED